MTFLRTPLIALFAVALTSSSASADVKVTIQNGRVSISAKDATVRQILTEWGRVGQTTIVNVERIPGGPQTIELTNVSETEALDVLLRSLSGFIAAPRTTPGGANASQFDRIVVMPTAAAPRAPMSVAAAPMPVPTPMPQVVAPQPVEDDVNDERQPTPGAAPPPGVPRGPVFNQFPQPQVVNPNEPAGRATPFYPAQPQVAQPPQPAQPPSAVPTAPFGGVAVPGMIVQPPPQSQPNQPGQPVRRPGGIEGA
jgi:hypothetical protein